MGKGWANVTSVPNWTGTGESPSRLRPIRAQNLKIASRFGERCLLLPSLLLPVSFTNGQILLIECFIFYYWTNYFLNIKKRKRKRKHQMVGAAMREKVATCTATWQECGNFFHLTSLPNNPHQNSTFEHCFHRPPADFSTFPLRSSPIYIPPTSFTLTFPSTFSVSPSPNS